MSDSPILEALVEFFTGEGWPFHKMENEENGIQIGYQGDNGLWNCFAKAREETSQLLFYSICPVIAPPEKREAVTEYLTRVNYGIVTGNFEMDLGSGVVRYKTYLSAEGINLTPDIIKQVVFPNLLLMDKFLPGLLKTVYSEISPLDAMNEAGFW